MKIKSKYVGVSWEKDRQKWKAQIDIRNNKKNLGRFDSEIQAAKKYDEYAKELDNLIFDSLISFVLLVLLLALSCVFFLIFF